MFDKTLNISPLHYTLRHKYPYSVFFWSVFFHIRTECWKIKAVLCYVMWNLFTVGSLQFCNDSPIASLKLECQNTDTFHAVKPTRFCWETKQVVWFSPSSTWFPLKGHIFRQTWSWKLQVFLSMCVLSVDTSH